MHMIETVLDPNVFDLNGKEYIQTERVAIGPRLGTNFACAYMRRWNAELEKSEKRPFFKRDSSMMGLVFGLIMLRT